jgi:hypothetical protein
MEGLNTQKGKKMSHSHMAAPKHESGYTDEVAEECHDLIDHAEEDAHVCVPCSSTGFFRVHNVILTSTC